MSARRRLNFADTDAVTAEVQHLRRGYDQLGHWSLSQISWHLGTAINRSMRPGPYEPQKIGMLAPILLKVVVTLGRIPAGRKAPARVQPADIVSDEAVDLFLTALADLKNFKGEFAPHPLFGAIKHRDFVKFHLVHSAHHLGFLIPTTN